MTKTKQKISLGIIGFIMSIIGLAGVLMPYFAIIFSIAAITLGSKQRRINETGMGTASTVIGIVGTVLNGIVLFGIILWLIIAGTTGAL